MDSNKKLLQCYNRGCGQLFDPSSNNEESCRHHPGAPFFHDAYKGWSCCNKKSVDFTEFLNIKGCTLSKHSNEKPPEPEKQQKEDEIAEEQEVVQQREPIKEALPRPPIDTPLVKIHATVAPALKDSIDKLIVKKPATSEIKSDSNEIAIGTSCKNSGCTYSYTGTAKDSCECEYHPGVPIFHEGLKFWSCCQKRTTDFAVFMEQKGCAYGQHKWKKGNNDKKVAQCRYDWHQTPSNVIVAIYAKMYHYEQSVIEVNPIRLHVRLVFPEQENAAFELDLELRGIIDSSKVNAHMFGSKVEITLPKAEPGSWQKLDFPNAKLPKITNVTPKEESTENNKKTESDDEFNLDDIETVNSGFRLAEIS